LQIRTGWGNVNTRDISLGVLGFVVGGMEVGYLSEAKQVLKYGQQISGQIRSAAVLTRANRISSTATAKYFSIAGKALGIYGTADAFIKLVDNPSNPANWVKFGANGGMLLMRTNPFTFAIGVGYTVIDQGGYIDNWIGTKP
jgi:hypothetical protein